MKLSNITWKVIDFDAITKDELYQLLRLRTEIFVVEQDCVYQDIDNKDQKAMHVLGYYQNELIAYARIFNVNDYFEYASIGRVLVKESFRKYKIGKELMLQSIKAIEQHYRQTTIAISAQEYLLKFYSDLGFLQQGTSYLEDGIPHLYMIKK